MKIVALLTGRGNNTLKDKNVLDVLGHPLLYYPAMAAKNSKYITEFYCSSDDKKILKAAEDCGYKRIVRPCELALPTAQHVDAIKHALTVMTDDGIIPDIIVVLLANAAIVKTEWIDEAIEAILNDEKLHSACPVTEEMDNHPYRSKKLNKEGYLEPWFDFNGENISTNRQDLPKNFVFCHNFWALKLNNGHVSETGQQPWTFMGDNIKPIIVEESFDVHTLDDIKKTEKWLEKEGINYYGNT